MKKVKVRPWSWSKVQLQEQITLESSLVWIKNEDRSNWVKEYLRTMWSKGVKLKNIEEICDLKHLQKILFGFNFLKEVANESKVGLDINKHVDYLLRYFPSKDPPLRKIQISICNKKYLSQNVFLSRSLPVIDRTRKTGFSISNFLLFLAACKKKHKTIAI